MAPLLARRTRFPQRANPCGLGCPDVTPSALKIGQTPDTVGTRATYREPNEAAFSEIDFHFQVMRSSIQVSV